MDLIVKGEKCNLPLNILEINNIVYVLLINIIMCLNSIAESNVPNIRNCT